MGSAHLAVEAHELVDEIHAVVCRNWRLRDVDATSDPAAALAADGATYYRKRTPKTAARSHPRSEQFDLLRLRPRPLPRVL
jgi:hypothetical protein